MNKLLVVGFAAALAACGCSATHSHSAPVAAATEEPLPPEEALPQRMPIKDATLGAGDQIQVRVYRHDDLNLNTTVPASGTIFLPLAGELNVSGVSAADVRRVIARKLDRYIVDPQVSVIVELQRSEKVVVLGEVRQPGVFVMEAPITALEGIARAGGFTNEGSERRVILLRPQPGGMATMILNLQNTLEQGDVDHNPTLRKGDVLFVPKSLVTNIDRFARHLSTWLAPVVTAESVIILGYDVQDRVSNTGIFIGG